MDQSNSGGNVNIAPGSAATRRRWLKLAGGAAALLPVVHLTGCAEEAPKPSAPAPKPAAAAPKPAAPAPKEVVETATKEVAQAAADAAPAAPSGTLVKIEESDPIAKALSYVHDAGSVDKAKQPRFAAGQNCASCAQYKANDADGWGGCAIFPGKLVADGGWCAGYIATS